MSWARRLPVLTVSVLALASVGATQEGPGADPARSQATAELSEALVEYRHASQPTAEHRWLEPLEGQWALEIGWAAPDGTPRKVVGTSENRWILGGRFLLCEASVGEEELPIEALSFYGFDTSQKRFFALRLDNLGTDFLELRGTYDRAARSFVLKGKERDEITGLSATYRMRLHVPDRDRHTIELFVDYPGRGVVKVLDVTYTRRDSAESP